MRQKLKKNAEKIDNQSFTHNHDFNTLKYKLVIIELDLPHQLISKTRKISQNNFNSHPQPSKVFHLGRRLNLKKGNSKITVVKEGLRP